MAATSGTTTKAAPTISRASGPLKLVVGEGENVADLARAEEQHGQTVDAEGDAGRGRHVTHRREKLFIHGIRRQTALGATPQILFAATALLDRIGELAEGVAELEAEGIRLEALD